MSHGIKKLTIQVRLLFMTILAMATPDPEGQVAFNSSDHLFVVQPKKGGATKRTSKYSLWANFPTIVFPWFRLNFVSI